MPGIRKDVATLGDGWNSTLEWYAKAIRHLKTKPVTDRTSWYYLAGIHGFDRGKWIAEGVIKATDPLPAAAELGRVWDQCQHQTWYFLPWHRGYLHAFEAIVAAAVKHLGGPSDWALPYWNQFGADVSLANRIPAAFKSRKMADGSPNPLKVPRTHTRLSRRELNLDAMKSKRYTAALGTLAFGGSATLFSHFGGGTSGALELNPHNAVHRRIGGFMEDPNTAGLDPIFWLHHCNVDRLWAAWLTQKGNVMEDSAAWKSGPARQFEMPGPDGNLHVFTPDDTMPGKPLAPTYDDLLNGTGLPATGVSSLEEISAEAVAMPAKLSSEPPPPATLVGASSGKVQVGASAVTTAVKLRATAALEAGLQGEERTFLNLENIRGTAPSASLTVRVGAAGKKASYSQSVALFGLAKASAADGDHGGNGINVAVDITEIAGKLVGAGASLDELEVSIEQDDAGTDPDPVTVGRISIYKQAVG